MKKGLLWLGFGLAGLALALGLTIGAFAVTGGAIGQPALPLSLRQQETSSPSPSPKASPTKHRHHHDRPRSTPSPTFTVAPSPPSSPSPSFDDHGGTPGGSDDHSGDS